MIDVSTNVEAALAAVSAPFDWRNPDYTEIFRKRAAFLAKLRANPHDLHVVRYYYRTHIDDFVNDWGVTVDPRVAASGRNPIMPMVLWPKQREFLQYLFARWKAGEPGLCEKSRDVGISWLAMGFSVALATLYNDVSVGFGSEKEDKVDRSGDPDCLFYKGRMFLQYLPPEFKAGWHIKSAGCSAHMRLTFPDTGSSITGEAGNNIGRGGRKSIYFVDESAHVPNPKAIDASLSANTDVRVDMSSVNGMANSFAERAHNPNIKKFTFHFRDDPRKDAKWEAKKRGEIDAVVFAAEYDINYTASVEGVVIPAVWVNAAVNAHLKFPQLVAQGVRVGGLDVSDGGPDANAMTVRHDWLIEHCETWRGSEDLDMQHTVDRGFLIHDLHKIDGGIYYDGDGLGAGVKGMARTTNEKRREVKNAQVHWNIFHGSGAVFEPEKPFPGTERPAQEFFENYKAQAWWALRRRFEYTYQCLEAFKAGDVWQVDTSRFISINGAIRECSALCIELSQAIWVTSKHGRVMVDKCPPGTKTEIRRALKSPNRADSVMIAFAPRRYSLAIHPTLLQASAPNVSQNRFFPAR